MNIENSFGKQLKIYRRRSALSQAEFGNLLNVYASQVIVSNWERGKTNIFPKERNTLISIVSVLKTKEGISSILEADKLLMLGGFSPLSEKEANKLGWKSVYELGLESRTRIEELEKEIAQLKYENATLRETEERHGNVFSKFGYSLKKAGIIFRGGVS